MVECRGDKNGFRFSGFLWQIYHSNFVYPKLMLNNRSHATAHPYAMQDDFANTDFLGSFGSHVKEMKIDKRRGKV